MERKAEFYGYEGYDLKILPMYMFEERSYTPSWYYYEYGSTSKALALDPANIDAYGEFTINIEEHESLLETANKVYVHPSCTIPRTMLSKKYKKCLDPLRADVIVIPEEKQRIQVRNETALFVNDDTKKALTCFLNKNTWSKDPHVNDDYNRIISAPGGTELIDLMPQSNKPAVPADVAHAKLVYMGPIGIFEPSNMYLFDILTYKMPTDRFVYQGTIMNTINDASNAPTYEGMMNIYDMLLSSNEDMVALGLKSLAALDYTNYPQSVITLLINSNYWAYSKAKYSTAVKYMLKTLGINNCRTRYYNRTVSTEDYELTKKLIFAIEKCDESTFINYCYNIPFVYVDNDFNVIPRLK